MPYSTGYIIDDDFNVPEVRIVTDKKTSLGIEIKSFIQSYIKTNSGKTWKYVGHH